MISGLGALICNFNFLFFFLIFYIEAQFIFVWYGTYFYWSWDIIEPMAYFSTSMGVIFLNF